MVNTFTLFYLAPHSVVNAQCGKLATIPLKSITTWSSYICDAGVCICCEFPGTHSHVCGNQKTASIVVSQKMSTFFLWDTVSHWSGACPLIRLDWLATESRHIPATSTELELQLTATTHACLPSISSSFLFLLSIFLPSFLSSLLLFPLFTFLLWNMGSGDWTRVLVLAKQAISSLSYLPRP